MLITWFLVMPLHHFKDRDKQTHSQRDTRTNTIKTEIHPLQSPIKPSNPTMLQMNEIGDKRTRKNKIRLTYQWDPVAIHTTLNWCLTRKHQFTTLLWNCRWGITPKNASNRNRMICLLVWYQHWASTTRIANPIPWSHHTTKMNVKRVKLIRSLMTTRYMPSYYVVRCLSFGICDLSCVPLYSEYNLSHSWFNLISFEVSLYLIVDDLVSSRFPHTFQSRREPQANIWSQWSRCRIDELAW